MSTRRVLVALLVNLLLTLSPAAAAPAADPDASALPLPVGAQAQTSVPLQLVALLNVVRDDIAKTVVSVAGAPAEARALGAAVARAWKNGDSLRTVVYGLLLLMIGGGAEWLYWCYAGKPWRATDEAAARCETYPPARAAALGLRRAGLSGLGASIFVSGALVPSSIFTWPGSVQAGIVGSVLAITAVRATRIVAEFILSPSLSRLRLLSLPDRGARRLELALVALSAAFAADYGAQSLLRAMPGLATLASAASGIVAAGLCLLVIRLCLPALGGASSRTSAILPGALAGLVVLCLTLHLIGAHQLVWTALVWTASVIIAKVTNLIVESFTATGDASGRAAEYRSVLKSGTRIVVFGAATLATAIVWNVPVLQLSQSPTFVGRLVARSSDLFVVVLITDLLWVWARTVIDGKLASIAARASEQNELAQSERLATLLPLLRKAILALLVGLGGLIALSALGVNIAPLLAGAGVAGIAIGLGAQSLVRDVVSGVFYLLADSFRIGEYVECGEARGTVEGISLRFLRIRHRRGAVYTVPFGEIKWLTNHSRDWAVMKLEFSVPFETDVALVKSIVEQIGAEFMANPNLAPYLLEPLASLGVIRMEEFGMRMGVKCVTNPGEGQFILRREAYHRIRDAFEEHGIRFGRGPKGENLHQHEESTKLDPHELSAVLHESGVEASLHTGG